MTQAHPCAAALSLSLTCSALGVGTCPCTTDLTSDGTTDAADLALLLGAWGPRGGPNGSSGDLDQSGAIDGADLAILLGAWGPCAAPANDQCSAANNVDDVDVVPFCTAAATTSDPANACGGASMGKDLWYRVDPSHAGLLFIDTLGSDFDTMLSVYLHTQTPERCLCPFVDDVQVIACNDDAAGWTLQSQIIVAVEEDDVGNLPCYTIRVGGYTDSGGVAAGAGVLNTYLVRRGDRCDVAHLLPSAIHQTVPGNTLEDSWIEFDQSSCALNDVVDEWFRFEMPCDGTVTFSTCNPSTNFDTTLAIFSDCGETEVACNDDATDAGCQIGGLNRRSKVTIAGSSSDVFYVRVAGFDGAEGLFALDIDVSCVH